jgi:hypothetical protein
MQTIEDAARELYRAFDKMGLRRPVILYYRQDGDGLIQLPVRLQPPAHLKPANPLVDSPAPERARSSDADS